MNRVDKTGAVRLNKLLHRVVPHLLAGIRTESDVSVANTLQRVGEGKVWVQRDAITNLEAADYLTLSRRCPKIS